MFIFGHIGITAFFAAFFSLSPLTAAIASQMPDVIDKSLYLLGLTPTARYIGHTLFIAVLFGFISYIVTKRKIFSLSIFFGMIMHLLEDLPTILFDGAGLIPWFFPFVNYNFSTEPWVFGYTLFLMIMDIIGIILIIILYKKNHVFRKELSIIFRYIKNIFKKV